MLSVDDLKSLMRRFVDEFQSKGDEAVADELLADIFRNHTAPPGIDRLEPSAVATVSNQLGAPEDVVNAAFLVERGRQEEFENAVENVGEELAGRVRLRLLGPVAPYDFTPEE